MKKKTKKISWLRILQGWAMLWVVIGHACLGKPGEGPGWENALYDFAYSFHMPLFMMISGYLFHITRLKDGERRGWTWKAIARDKAKRLLLPGLVFSIVALASKIAFPGEMDRRVGLSLTEILHAYLYPYDNPFRELWFIFTLFGFFLLAPVWKRSLSNAKAMCVTMCVLIVLHYFHPQTEFLCIHEMSVHCIWFYLGLVLSKEDYVNRALAGNLLRMLAISATIYFIGRYSHTDIATLAGISLSVSLAMIADRQIPKLFFSFRDYTYQIFLMGIFAQTVVKIMYRHVSVGYPYAYLLSILAGIYVPVAVSRLLERINNRHFLICIGLKEK